MARPSSQLQDPALLAAALEGLEAQKKRIEDQISTVHGMMGRRGPGRVASSHVVEATSNGSGGSGRRKRVLSEEARLRIAAAQKKRWAAFRKVKKSD